MNTSSKPVDDFPSVSHQPIGFEVSSKIVDNSKSDFRSLKYEETHLKPMADDLRRMVREQFHSQIEAIEKMSVDSQQRVVIAEKELALYEKQLAMYADQLSMYAKQIADAEKESKAAALRSWIAIGISIAAIIGSIAGCIIGAVIGAGWI